MVGMSRGKKLCVRVITIIDHSDDLMMILPKYEGDCILDMGMKIPFGGGRHNVNL